MTPPPHVRILMCTFNGAAYLSAQLESFLAQSHGDWSLWVSDDGSGDGTLDILSGFQAAHPDRDIRIVPGPRRGVAQNYFSLLARTAPEPETLIALSDQDDVWLPEKLARAVTAIRTASPQGPVAYAGARHLADAELRIRGQSWPVPRGPSFENALLQNILPGHSLVLNPAAHALVQAAGLPATVDHHDWWIYLLTSGAGGRILYDAEPLVIYRQHHGNVRGGNQGAAARLSRAAMIWNRKYGAWFWDNVDALAAASGHLTVRNRLRVEQIAALRNRKGPVRAWRMWRSGLHRQTTSGTLAVLAAAALGRL